MIVEAFQKNAQVPQLDSREWRTLLVYWRHTTAAYVISVGEKTGECHSCISSDRRTLDVICVE